MPVASVNAETLTFNDGSLQGKITVKGRKQLLFENSASTNHCRFCLYQLQIEISYVRHRNLKSST